MLSLVVHEAKGASGAAGAAPVSRPFAGSPIGQQHKGII